MKNFIRKAMGLAVTTTLMMGLLAGCGSESSSTSQTTAASEANVAEKETVKEVEKEEGGSSTATSDEPVVVKIGTFGICAWNYPIIVAKEFGIWDEVFKDENVELDLTTSFTTGPEANEALTAGSLDLIWGEGDQPFLTGIQNGVDISIIAKVTSQDETIVVVAGGDNSEINSIADLNGKRIAVAVGTITHKSLIGDLKDNNVDVDSVELVNFSTPGDVVAAIGRGDVDAYIGYIFDINSSIKDGTLKKIGDSTGNPASTFILASNDFIDKYPDITEKIVEASEKGAEFIKENKDEAYDFIAEGTGWSLEDMNDLYPLIHTEVEFTDDDLDRLKITEQFLIDNDILDGELPTLETEHINRTFIDKVKAGN
jgi:ABC-type nitrate/sulfonate/bicarbonate transport system substrate-binding protein